MIELLQFAPGSGLMNLSPFCMKVEVFVRLAGLEYRCINDATPLRAPKGKLPVLRDAGTVVPDSAAIVAYLQQRYASRMPAALAVPETASHLALRRLIEDHLYFAMLRLRWIDDAGWAFTKPAFFGGLPPLVGDVIAGLVRRKMRRDLQGQGLGRHDRPHLCREAIADVDALVAALGEQAFYGGAEPAAIDAVVYAFLANMMWVPVETPVKAHALQQSTLLAYAERMKARVGA